VLAIWAAPSELPAESAAASADTGLPAVDMSRLNDLFEGDRQAIIDLMAVFRESMVRIRGRIVPAASAHESQVADLAHEARGMAGNLGAETLAALATRFEHAASRGEWETVDTLSGSVEREIERVLAFVDDYIRN
jgi:HPt (histidine-containing phosphotransfer) domain-containing protein